MRTQTLEMKPPSPHTLKLHPPALASCGEKHFETLYPESADRLRYRDLRRQVEAVWFDGTVDGARYLECPGCLATADGVLGHGGWAECSCGILIQSFGASLYVWRVQDRA